ncbi:hypothetical protein PYW07_002341 [Mythimna separata]|uniref:Fatty acid desaturase domain-containing protein n=1 Tax=Mythimna separata TaxID=271217 RepID=A0AAD7YMN4_MYTSE|nr:hypothetical protein PYW07_002341 [Mythimna separata]
MQRPQSITDNSNSSNDLKHLKSIDSNAVLSPHSMIQDLVWRKVIIIAFIHITGSYGVYLLLTVAKWQTWLFLFLTQIATSVSITAGAHRLWTHKSYKAKLPLRIILLTLFTMTFQFSCISWVRIHRQHHKFSDTDADPHNAKRGFFFSHIGWSMVKRHPEVRAHTVDLSDVMADPLLRFQHKYYSLLLLIIGFIVPTYIPTLWAEETKVAFFVCACLRCVIAIHMISLVNSVAHMWGNKPYDKYIEPVESKMVSFLAAGEGFHNYHHSFPWDYRAAELGGYSLNLSKLFIDFMATIGWAYDLKVVPDELIKRRVERTGDGTHPVWGWDDPDLSADDKKFVVMINKTRNTDGVFALDNIVSFLRQQFNISFSK